ncbi:MAG: ArnT family glycosyltransferase [Gemmataceae bacterium]
MKTIPVAAIVFIAVLALAALLRAGCLVDGVWEDPFDYHHTDESLLPYEALASWEGVVPRELGWPGATTRLALSAVYAMDMVLWQPGLLFSPTALFDAISARTQQHLADPTRLVVLGRVMVLLIGLGQVALTWWALRRWSSLHAAWLGAVLSAMAPVLVLYSQLILADMTGALFATWLVGLAGGANSAPRRRALAFGVLVGLAAASKYHFAVWLLPAALWIWFDVADRSRGARLVDLTLLGLSSALVLMLLVPWWWINPILALKEFLHVVAAKLDTGAGSTGGLVAHIRLAFAALGCVLWLGLAPGIASVKEDWRQRLPLLVVVVVWSLFTASAAQVYERYFMPMVPAALVLAALGWEAWLTSPTCWLRRAGFLALFLALAATLSQVVQDQQFAGKLDSYGQAHQWLLAHLQQGDRVAADSLYGRHLPRTRVQLAALIAERSGPDAYARKLVSNRLSAHDGQPFRNAVLNDELYELHWLRRELGGREKGTGYIVDFHDARELFNSRPTNEVFADFVHGLENPTEGYDYLLSRQPLPGREADVVFAGQPGPKLYLYQRRKP